MQRYLLSRLVQSLLLMVGVVVLVFFMVRLTGDPSSLMVSRDADADQIAEFRAAMGFDRPLVVQFGDYFAGLFSGDMGDSLKFRQPALDIILQRLPPTLQLALAGLTMAVVVAIPLGILGGLSPGSPMDALARFVGLIGQVTPSFWLMMILIIVFAVKLGWFPAFGRGGIRNLVLPAFALGIGGMGQLVRLTRSSVLEIRNEDYIRTARSKGLSQFNIALKHVARNAALALISVIGVQFTYMLGGSVYIESIYSWPGLGNLLDEAIRGRDFPLVQAITIFIASFAIMMNFATEVAYTLIDPRIRSGR